MPDPLDYGTQPPPQRWWRSAFRATLAFGILVSVFFLLSLIVLAGLFALMRLF